jgi:hypothetical protein
VAKLNPRDVKQIAIDALTTDDTLAVTTRDGERFIELSPRDILHVATRIAIEIASNHAGKVVEEL